MKGKVLDFSVQSNSGVITGEDGSRYNFAGSEWNGDTPPARGTAVDFEAKGEDAAAVYKALGGAAGSGGTDSKNKMAAGLLGIFLGSLGVHKFYLGMQKPALIMLLVTLLTCGFGGAVMGVIGLIEGIIYLTKTDEQFQQEYIDQQKAWF